MTSYRRTNEPRPLEVEGSTAGASGGGDLGRVQAVMMAKRLAATVQEAIDEAAVCLEGATESLNQLRIWIGKQE